MADRYCYTLESSRSCPTFTMLFESHKNLFFGFCCTTKSSPCWS